MNQAEKKFRLYAVISVFVLLTILLGIMNAVNFTLASRDADRVTEMISEEGERFFEKPGMMIPEKQPMQPGGLGPMGPDSPELGASIRYFTVSFEEDEGRLTAYHINAVSEEEALQWASSLQKEKTGWTRGTYRYRVYKKDGVKYVTVIDQGRELLPAYRTLIYSGCGIIAVTLLSWIFLKIVGKKLFAPIDEADRRQKQFIEKAEREFKLPLTVIGADLEVMERESGPTDRMRSIRRQVRKMNALVRKLGSLSVYEEKNVEKSRFSLSGLVSEQTEKSRGRFEKAGIRFSSDIQEGIMLNGEEDSILQLISELFENALKYAREEAMLALKAENGRIQLTMKNRTELPEGPADQVFDRFTTLENAENEAAGLGLANVRDIVKAHNGRIHAEVKDHFFLLVIDL